MARIEIDLDEFSTDEIIQEIESRYNSRWRKSDKKDIEDMFIRLKMPVEEIKGSVISSVSDDLKMKFITENFNKITIEKLENII